jgi:Ni,Fe-hydrogenase III small subunit
MFFGEIQILLRHGRQYVRDLQKVELTPLFRGKPVIFADIPPEETERLVKLCPTGAIGAEPCAIDIGRCVFCKECEFASNGRIRFSNDWKLATNSREALIVRAGVEKQITVNPEKIRKEIRSFFKHALKLRQVSAGGDNSCEMELNAAGNVNFDMGRYGIEFVASPRHADGIIITGPISENMAAALQICYDAVPDPKIVILCGTDAISGGGFAGSPALNQSFLDNYHIDLYVPGNPPHPLTFINGVLELIGRKF